MRPLLQLTGVSIGTPGGRPLFDALDLVVGRERIAIVGRNGAGKSTLLAVLAGDVAPREGRLRAASTPRLVPQMLEGSASGESAASKGELRRAALEQALSSGAEILLLDEPTEDLDGDGVAWLRQRLAHFAGCLLVVSHDRRLLQDFSEFFVVAESGCRHVAGTFAEVEAALVLEHAASERKYVRSLARLAAREEHTDRVSRRRDRKKRHGRCSELDRATPRIRLNAKRSAAQVYQGKFTQQRQARLEAVRQWTRSARRALSVSLPLRVSVPELSSSASDVLSARGLTVVANGSVLFESVDLALGRRRVAVVGPNGSGKTTLLDVLLGHRQPSAGAVRTEPSRIGSIQQCGANWTRDESLIHLLGGDGGEAALAAAARALVAARFPLALAERPLRSLSPGERTRAALLCLFRRPGVEVLVLDEPTYSLDLVGLGALTEALRAWRGGLVVASHDQEFLAAVGIEEWIRLGGREECGERWRTR